MPFVVDKKNIYHHGEMSELLNEALGPTLGIKSNPAVMRCANRGTMLSVNLASNVTETMEKLKIEPRIRNIENLTKLLSELLPSSLVTSKVHIVMIPSAFVKEEDRHYEENSGTEMAVVPRWQISLALSLDNSPPKQDD
jgi:hypothetical protein